MTKGLIELPFIPGHCEHNAHMFYIKTANLNERSKLIHYLKQKKIVAIFHYVPLHSSEAGKKFGRFFGEDNYTTKESDKLLRLPMFYKLPEKDIDHIVKNIKEFYGA
jgi:dTDP-4-amino-4,6-dideoxygalactose transaminase